MTLLKESALPFCHNTLQMVAVVVIYNEAIRFHRPSRFQHTQNNHAIIAQFFHTSIKNNNKKCRPRTYISANLRSKHAADKVAREAARQIRRSKGAAREIRRLAELVASGKGQRVDDGEGQRNS